MNAELSSSAHPTHSPATDAPTTTSPARLPATTAQGSDESRARPGAARASAPRASATPSLRSIPVLRCAIELHTDFARRVYHRVWDRLKADLYVITVRSEAVGLD